MGSLIDTRHDEPGDGHIVSRKRLEERATGNIDEAVERALSRGKISDLGKKDIPVTIPRDDLKEPHIHHGKDGSRDIILPGNEDLTVGDRMSKPRGNQGQRGKQGAEDGVGEEIEFMLSSEDFKKRLFDRLGLPNQSKRVVTESDETISKRAGFSSQGPFSRLDLRQSLARRNVRLRGAERPFQDVVIALLEEEKTILMRHDPSAATEEKAPSSKDMIPRKTRILQLETAIGKLKPCVAESMTEDSKKRVAEIESEVAGLKDRMKRIPKWNESTDLRYRHNEEKPLPASKAVVFFEMDVSGSMDDETKKRAMLFFWLMHEMLEDRYKRVDVVFLRHTTFAEEVDEDTFFNKSMAGGGTIVSSVHEKMAEVIKNGSKLNKTANYDPKEWNIYGAHASDGDNSSNDNAKAKKLLQDMLPDLQAYFYAEIKDEMMDDDMFGWQHPPGLWDTYTSLAKENPDMFFMGKIKSREDIWPVFREFFTERSESGNKPSAFSLNP
jgi:uncharacterized sporulation protein YeaH/YhbH (DUF444 family)